jgi:hypothetical protein
MSATQADIDRFMSYVDKLPNGCWFWTGARSRGKGNRKWYGSWWFNGKAIRQAKANPDVEFKHGLTTWWPTTGREIVEQFRRGMVERINEAKPYSLRGAL